MKLPRRNRGQAVRKDSQSSGEVDLTDIKGSPACSLRLGVLQAKVVARHQVRAGNNGHPSEGGKEAAVGVSLSNAVLPRGQQEHKEGMAHPTKSFRWHWAIQLPSGTDNLLPERASPTLWGTISVGEEIQGVPGSHATGGRAECQPSHMPVQKVWEPSDLLLVQDTVGKAVALPFHSSPAPPRNPTAKRER